MKKIVINNDNRRFNISSIVVGYLEENKEEVLEFEIPEKYAEYGKKACFSANGQTFAKNFDDIISNKLTITRDISQFKELDMTIAFFKIENEDEIVARTSILHILIENAIICDDDVKPDEPKIIILDNLIDEVTKLDVLVTKNEKKREEYYQEIQKKVDNGDFNGATFTPSVDTEGNISWTNDKNLPNPTTQNIKGPKGPKGDTYNLTEQDKKDISSITVESSESTFNQYYNDKLKDFNSNATSKTNDYNTNATNKTNEFNTNADNKIAEYDLHSQELDNKIVSTRNELERVKNDVLETGTDTDTYIHLEDSAMAEYQELSVDGVCEQEGINYFDGDIITGYVDYDGNIVGTGWLSSNSYVPIEENEDYIITGNNMGSRILYMYYNVNKEYIGSRLETTEGTTITAPSEAKYMRFSTNNTSATNMKVSHPLSPDHPQPISTIENSLKITSCNKNLLKTTTFTDGTKTQTKNGVNATINDDGTITCKGTATEQTTFYLTKNDLNFTLGDGYFLCNSPSTNQRLEFVCTVDGNKRYLNSYGVANFITANSTFEFDFYYLYIAKGETVDNTFAPMFAKGTIATGYEQHLETQITANLPEGEFIGKINDTYKDTLKVEYNETDGQYHLNLYKNVGKIVLNGSENWGYYNNVLYTDRCSGYSNSNNTPYCNYYKGISNVIGTAYVTVNNTICFNKDNKNNPRIFVKDTRFTKGSDFKTWLSTHNTEVYYSLATPYEVDLGIVDMPITYNEITNLFTDSDLLPTINAKYYRNFISTVRNLQVNEKALKQELIDINTRLSALESAQTSTTSESEVVE